MSDYVSRSETGYQLCSLDRELIKLTQSGLPLVSRPYHALAEQLGVSADEVKTRFQRMLDHGVIRRIAAVPNHYRLGSAPAMYHMTTV